MTTQGATVATSGADRQALASAMTWTGFSLLLLVFAALAQGPVGG
jgi:hypothetical protein